MTIVMNRRTGAEGKETGSLPKVKAILRRIRVKIIATKRMSVEWRAADTREINEAPDDNVTGHEVKLRRKHPGLRLSCRLPFLT